MVVLQAHGRGDSFRNMIYYYQSLIYSLDSRKICYCPHWGYVMIVKYLDLGRRSGIARPVLFDLDPPLLPLMNYSRQMMLIAFENKKQTYKILVTDQIGSPGEKGSDSSD